MAQKAAERIVWAVEKLAVQPNEHILEIGCGHGVAVSLVCEKLHSGTITAIDRSQTMIEMAQRRNRPYIEAGKASFHCTTLERAEFGDQRFDKLFAIRVNFFIQQPDLQLPKIRSLLAPGGALYLFFDPPNADQITPFVDSATQALQAHGFTIIKESSSKTLPPVQGVCIVAIGQSA